jgi:hypothetical protein
MIVLDVNAVQVEFQSNPNMAFHFFRWLAAMLTRKSDRALTIKEALEETESVFDPDLNTVAPPKSDILQARAAEKRKHQLMALREKFGVPADEPVLHVAGDLFRRHRGKKFYGNAFVTMHHFAFLPSTITQQAERWIAESSELETAFVDKSGALEIVFAGGEVRHLYHEDRNVLNEVVSHINQMKTLAEGKKQGQQFRNAAASPENSPPPVKRQNIREKVLQKSMSRGSLSASMRGSRRLSVPSTLPSSGSSMSLLSMSGSVPLPSPSSSSSSSGLRGTSMAIDEDQDQQASAVTAVASAVPDAASPHPMLPEGAPPDWTHVRIVNVLSPAGVKKIITDSMKKKFKVTRFQC